jgi:hypothetical protein
MKIGIPISRKDKAMRFSDVLDNRYVENIEIIRGLETFQGIYPIAGR